MRRGSGLADWNTFSLQLKSILLEYRRKHGRIPGRRTMQKLGYTNLVSAAYHHHGGYATCLARLGLKAKRPHVVRRWANRRVQEETLKTQFREWLDWGLMPSSNAMLPVVPGLAYHWLRTPSCWADVAKSFHLEPADVGMPKKTHLTAVIEALDFYEARGNWPVAEECSNRLRKVRYRNGHSWMSILERNDFNPQMTDRYLRRLQQHFAWCQIHAPGRASIFHQLINAAIIRKNSLEPFGRLFP